MLEVIFYQSTEDLTSTETSGNPLIICPSPIIADGLRRLMPDNSEIITISKWVSDFLKNKNLKRSNKADLMLRLSSVWRHYHPTAEAHLFFKAFELFTDLRSFSLNIEFLSEFLKETDEVTTKSILIFWAFLQNEKLIDEHLSYQMLSEMEINRPIWIVGFKHLSGTQIDMLKVLSERTQVFVFFPHDVYNETLSTDWIRWLIPENKLETPQIQKELKIVYFPKNKLNVVLDSLKKNIPSFDLTLASQNLSLNSRQEVSVKDLFFKSPEDLFKTEREELMDEYLEDFKLKTMDLAEFGILIADKKKKALILENFILYKILLLLEAALVLYGEFQNTVDQFSLKILKMILELNSPRVALATISQNTTTRILELNELPFKESSLPLVMVATSNYGALKSQDGKYSEKMIEALRVIAPVKRAGLDFSYLKHEIIQTLAKKDSVLLMEEGLEIVDLSWREILKGFELININTNPDYKLKQTKDHLQTLLKPGPFVPKNISASRLQVFMDCPRKYYFSYIEKLDHRPLERLKIAPDEMGIIEHDIIEKYFDNRVIDPSLSFEPEIHKALCKLSLETFILEHKILLNDKTKLTTYYELLHYTQNGIEFLINYIKSNSAIKIEFELKLGNNPWELVGAIDCVIHLKNDQIALFDFKRSGAAIGSKKETLAFDKLQIWVYLLIMYKHVGKIIHTWGYLNLSEIEASQVYNELETPMLEDEVMESFDELLKKLIFQMKSEINFTANPRVQKVCDFCEVQLFCSKGSC